MRATGMAGASRSQQARGIHFQARDRPQQQCVLCGRVGTRSFVRADFSLTNGVQHRDQTVCSNRDACEGRMGKGHRGPAIDTGES